MERSKTRAERKRKQKKLDIVLIAALALGSVAFWGAFANAAKAWDEPGETISEEREMYLAWQAKQTETEVVGSVFALHDEDNATTEQNGQAAEPVKAHYLSDEEFYLLCGAVMTEAGGESHEGKIAVAQCILNAREKEGCDVAEVLRRYRYATPAASWTEEAYEAAFAAVFGKQVTEEKILYFYAPALCESPWHESLRYVCTIGGHRFFAEWEG